MNTKPKRYSRFAALLMVFVMVFTMIPPMAFAGTSESYPFSEITTDKGSVKKIMDKGTVTYGGYSTYENVPYYHIIIPEGATEVYVTHPSSEDPFADSSYGSAYGYCANTESWTGSGTTFDFEAATDGYKITLPLSVMVDTDGDWTADTEGSFVADEDGNVGYAVAVERNDFSPICFFTFEYGVAESEEPANPFMSIKIGENEVASDNIAYKGIFNLGDYEDSATDGSDSYDYVHEVPYYQVTVPCGTESVDVTYPADADIMNYGSDAYGYKTDIDGIDAMTSATVKGATFTGAYTQNEDGTQTVKTPVKGYTFGADGNGHAITLEGNGEGYPALCLFSFVYDGINHVYTDGVCSCGAEAPAENIIPEGAPFSALTTDVGAVKSVTDKGTVTYVGYDTYENVPSYHVTIPEGATEVYVTHPSSENPFIGEDYTTGTEVAYGYYADTESWNGGGINLTYQAATDGFTVTLPVTREIDTDWDNVSDTEINFWANSGEKAAYAVGVERTDYTPICFFTFEYAAGENTDESEHTHDYGTGEVTTDPTCTEAGVRTYTCTCGDTYTEEEPATGHNYDKGVITDEPTCTEEGLKTFTCSNCTEGTEGHTKTESVEATGHSYDEGVVDPEATCTEAGVKTFTCSACEAGTVGHSYTETIESKGHQYGDDKICDVCEAVNPAPDQDENGIYQITNAVEMVWFAEAVNEGNTGISGKLTADIELDADWPGIGTSANKFSGSFDGNNKTITLNGSTFGVIAFTKGTSSAYVQIQNIITKGNVKNSAIAHSVIYTNIDHCTNYAAVGGSGSNSYVAGIVGEVNKNTWDGQSAANITNCANEGAVCGNQYVAGILGWAQTRTKVANCYNSGAITGTNNVGGLVGFIQEYKDVCEVRDSYNTGKISGNSATGGLVGNLYNGMEIANCYNAGEATYAIAGSIYDNTVSITNTYYRGNLCAYSVPNKTASVGYYTNGRGASQTSVEMSSAEFAALLGDAFIQSCPSPVLSGQTASDHTMENNVCTVCKDGNGVPEEYLVTFVTDAGSEVVGDTTFRAGNSYTFSINVLAGYYATEDFGVYVNGVAVEAVDGVYTVVEPDGPFYISVSGVKEEEGILPIVLPAEGDGYRVNPCEGYGLTVERDKEYKFTVSFVEGFEAGEDFVVKVNGSIVKADENGVYTIDAVTEQQTITVEDVDVVPSGNTVAVDVDITKGENQFLVSEETEAIMMDKTLEIPYFDIELYDLEKYYYNPYCYLDENGNVRGQQKAGTRESAYDVVTSMHAFIYVTEVYYLGYDPEDAGKGLSHQEDTDKDGISDFDEAVSWTQNVGSTFMDLWGLGSNLNYHINYEYPIAYPEWGSTSDQQALEDGDRLSIHMITGSASGSGFGLFVVNDTNDSYDRTEQKDSAVVKQGESITLTHYLATQGDSYTTNFVKATNKALAWVKEGDETEDIRDWNTEGGFGTLTAEEFMTDEHGVITINTAGIEPGVYYIGAAGGFEEGSGVAGSDGFVSNGSESGPAYFKLTVEEAESGVDVLAIARDEAKKEVAAYKNAEDYRDAQKAELTAAIESANTAIDAAETAEAIAKAVTEAKAAMDSIKTDAQLKAEEEAAAAEALAKAKTDAKKEVAAYKNAADYREAQKAELTAVIESANTAIDAAETAEAIAEAVTAAKAAMDSIKTDAQLKAEEEANKPADTVKLKTPTNVKATNIEKTGKIKLTWTKVSGAEKYKIYRATSKDGKFTYMNTVTGTSYTNTSAKAGKTYYYKVMAVSGDKNVKDSAYSKVVKRTCDLARPVVKASNVAKTGKIKLTWSKVTGAEKYKIYRATSKNGKYTYMKTVTGTSYTNTSAKAGKVYYYKVKAIDTDNTAANSAFSVVDKRTCDLARPDVTVKSKTKKQVKLTWKKVTNAKKYVIYRSTSKNGKYTKIATTTKLSYTNKKLKSGKTYYYKVKAISKNSAANSAFSTVDKCKVK